MRPWLFPLLLVACDTAVEQSSSCAQWVQCIDARDAQLDVSTDNDRYLDGGLCWGNPEIGALCDQSCTSGLAWMRTAYADLPTECM